MPIYEYRCEQGHTFEVMQRMSDDPVVSCQTCEAPVQRVFHPVAVHFKGSGFYNTDYGTRKRAKEKAEGESTSSDSKPSSDSTKKPESKPETKPPVKPAAD
jgi:putative FmdB family regulatory protein